MRPIITLGAYPARLGWVAGKGEFESSGDTLEQAWEEFALLAYLEVEALDGLPDKPEWLPMVLKKALDQRAVVDTDIAAKLMAALSGRNAPSRKGRGK